MGYMCGGENNTPDDAVFSQGEIQTLVLYENLLLKVGIQFYIQVKVEERVQDKNFMSKITKYIGIFFLLFIIITSSFYSYN